MKTQKMKVAKQGDMRKLEDNLECKIICDSGINSRNESIEVIEEELQVIFDSFRDTPKEVYKEKLEIATNKLYEAQEVAVWESTIKGEASSRNKHRGNDRFFKRNHYMGSWKHTGNCKNRQSLHKPRMRPRTTRWGPERPNNGGQCK